MNTEMFDNLPSWAIVTQDNKFFNSSSFYASNANPGAMTMRFPQLSCATRIDIIP